MNLIAERTFSWGQKLLAEFLGSAMLVFVIVSAGLLFYDQLGAGIGPSVLAIGLGTAGWLFIIVEIFGPISGAHVNPMVTIALRITGDIDWKTFQRYIPVQFVGGLFGVFICNLTFVATTPMGWEVFAISAVERPWSTWIAEFWGSWVLASVVIGCVRKNTKLIGLAVGGVVGMGIISTSGTMFVNPQVSFARIFTAGIAGIRPFDAIWFIIASSLGGAAAGMTWNYLWPGE